MAGKKTKGAGRAGAVWTPANLGATLQVWGGGSGIVPQSAGSDNLTAWNGSAGAPNLGSVNGTPSVLAGGPGGFAGEFVRASSEAAFASGVSISKASAGAMWIVFAMRSGFAPTQQHGLLSIGSTGSGTRLMDLWCSTASSQIYPQWRCHEGGTNTRSLSRTTALTDTAWHSLLVHYTGSAHEVYWDESAESWSLTTAGTPPNWLSGWHASITPNRIAVGSQTTTTLYNFGDLIVRDWGVCKAAMSAGETTSLLGWLAGMRA